MDKYQHNVKTTCKFCRKEFRSFGLKKVCDDCDNTMDRQFQIIKAYLNEFPEATIYQICNDLDIPTALVKYYLREERLELLKNSGNLFLKCNMCGKPITTGRYCFECEIEVVRSDMKGVLAKNEDDIKMEKEIGKFHSLRNLRIKNAKK